MTNKIETLTRIASIGETVRNNEGTIGRVIGWRKDGKGACVIVAAMAQDWDFGTFTPA